MRNESRKARWTDQGQPVVRGEERQRWSNFEWNRENGLASLGNGPRIHRRQRAESWLENLALYPCSAVGHPVMRNMKSGSHGLWMGTPRYMYVRVCAYICIYIFLSRSPAWFPTRVYILLCIVAPHAYRGRISGVLCPCVQQDIVHWETGKQVLEELTCTLFNRTLLLFMEKPLSSFFRQNKSCGYS